MQPQASSAPRASNPSQHPRRPRHHRSHAEPRSPRAHQALPGGWKPRRPIPLPQAAATAARKPQPGTSSSRRRADRPRRPIPFLRPGNREARPAIHRDHANLTVSGASHRPPRQRTDLTHRGQPQAPRGVLRRHLRHHPSRAASPGHPHRLTDQFAAGRQAHQLPAAACRHRRSVPHPRRLAPSLPSHHLIRRTCSSARCRAAMPGRHRSHHQRGENSTLIAAYNSARFKIRLCETTTGEIYYHGSDRNNPSMHITLPMQRTPWL